MKYTLVLVPIILLVILNACATPASAGEDAQIDWTSVWQTVTATYMPPPSPTREPQRMAIVNAMNIASSQYAPDYGGPYNSVATTYPLAANLDDLEDSLVGARMTVLNIDFPVENDAQVFQIQARCECANEGNCCTAERMLVQTIKELYLVHKLYVLYPSAVNQQYLYLTAEVPTDVEWMRLLCFEHRRQFATVTLPWQEVLSFLNDQSNGYMLGTSVTMVP